jgi:hypothetical protein
MDRRQPSESVTVFERSVAEGIDTSIWDSLNEWVFEECTECGKLADQEDPPFEANLFDVIVSLFDDGRFLSSPGSYNVLKILENEWGRLTDEQRDALLPVLTDHYVKFDDFMGRFMTAELLGEYYADVRALNSLRIIKIRAVGAQREMIPMGFKCLVQNATDETVRNAAMSELRAMQHDEPLLVQEAAERAVSSLGSR